MNITSVAGLNWVRFEQNANLVLDNCSFYEVQPQRKYFVSSKCHLLLGIHDHRSETVNLSVMSDSLQTHNYSWSGWVAIPFSSRSS